MGAKRPTSRLVLCLLTLSLLYGCTAEERPVESDVSAVADASQTAEAQESMANGLTPLYTDALNDGVYRVKVDCSSSMFKIEDCTLAVADGTMTATLLMGSDAYGFFFAGTAEEAAAADFYIAPENRAFDLPIEALDAPVACAAWSVRKKLWYDRTLVFRSDSLPLSAFRALKTVESLGLADGTYTVEVTLGGGSGKAGVTSPAALWIEDGAARATLQWSSANYDYMLVDGERYEAEIIDGRSVFLIPVAAFDHPLAVVADTTAMSQPYEIAYTLVFDSGSIQQAG